MRTALILAFESLLASRFATCINAMLIAVSVVCVAAAVNAFDGLRRVVAGIAGQGSAWEAIVDVSRCAQCPALRRQSPMLQRALVEQRTLTVHMLQPNARLPAWRSARVVCVSPERTPPQVHWRSRELRAMWHGASGEPVVLAGARVPLRSAPSPFPSSPPYIRTDHGNWLVAGVLLERPMLSQNAEDNDALLVPLREPFSRLCAGGVPSWRIIAPDSLSLSRAEELVNGELRTLARLRPGERAPWSIMRSDRLARLAGRLVSRFRRWVMLVPVMVALLCGAAVFSVQALEAESRVAEFAVRRAVGATPQVLRGQLAMEVIVVILVGAIVGSLGLLMLGGVAASTLHGVAIALIVVAPLAALGLTAPIAEALRSTSLASLEGRAG